MKKIQMVDLKGQYEGIKDRINTSFQEVLDSTAFINGPEVHAFQKRNGSLLGCKTCNSMC